ncbi:MAG: class I SAM-dependent methyltransferase [Pseudomonadota bacterium]
MTVHTDLLAYYTQCAPTYDQLYQAPERQADLTQLHARVRDKVAGQRVLELACGTGYWTTYMATSAAKVCATDLNAAMLDVACTKHPKSDNVTFTLADAYALPAIGDAEIFDACFASGWWSHVPRERQVGFLNGLRDRLAPGARLLLIDDIYVEGHSTPIARTDVEGNTYQIHRLANGERYEVLKNFSTDSTLRKRLGGHLKDLRIERFTHYWLLSGRFK